MKMADTVVKKPIVTIEMEDGGIITIELYPSKAPETVNNFISLINMMKNCLKYLLVNFMGKV